METKTKMLGLVLAAGMVISPILVYADNGGGDKDSWHHEGAWHHQDHRMCQILNLSNDQIKQLKDNRKKQKEAMKSLFEQIKSNREALNSEIIKAAPDMNKINSIETQLKTLQSQMIDNHLNAVLEVKKIMTPEQFVGYMVLEKEEDLKKHDEHNRFGLKDGFDGNHHEHWGDKPADKDRSSDE